MTVPPAHRDAPSYDTLAWKAGALSLGLAAFLVAPTAGLGYWAARRGGRLACVGAALGATLASTLWLCLWIAGQAARPEAETEIVRDGLAAVGVLLAGQFAGGALFRFAAGLRKAGRAAAVGAAAAISCCVALLPLLVAMNAASAYLAGTVLQEDTAKAFAPSTADLPAQHD